jgi:hypothetical protein
MPKLVRVVIWGFAWVAMVALMWWAWELPPNPQTVIHVGEGRRLVGLSPTGRWVVTAVEEQDNRTLEIWDTQTRECRHHLDGPLGWSDPRQFSPDGQFLMITRSAEHRLFDTVRGCWVEQPRWPGSLEYGTFHFSSDGRWLAVDAYSEAGPTVWDLTSMAKWKVDQPAREKYTFNPAGPTIAFFNEIESSFSVWDIATCRRNGVILVPEAKEVDRFVLSPDGMSLVALLTHSENDGRILPRFCCWDVASGVLRYTSVCDHENTSGIRFSPDGRYLAVAIRYMDSDRGPDQTLEMRDCRAIELRDPRNGLVLTTIPIGGEDSIFWGFTANGRLLWARTWNPAEGWDGKERRWWDLSGAKPRELTVPQIQAVVDQWTSQNEATPGLLGVIRPKSSWLDRWEVATASFFGPGPPSPDVMSKYSPDGRWCLVRVGYTLRSGEIRDRLSSFFPQLADWSPNDYRASLVDQQTGRIDCTLSGADFAYFTSDGRMLALQANDFSGGAWRFSDIRLYSLPVTTRWPERAAVSVLVLALAVLSARRLIARRRQPA